MTKENRIQEILNAMPSFSKGAYHKEELLPQYLELQNELINFTFNDTHAENSKLRIRDVEDHLEKLNEECGHIVDEEFKVFKEECISVCNAIKSEFSGNAGEQKAFHSLETLGCKNKVLKNIEFKSGSHRTEIDAIVFTEKAVFIIEVKNPHRDIRIDERGNYYRVRVGDTEFFDCNIGEKMNEKVYLLREALKATEYSNVNIVSLVVFTNSTINVENRYEYITTCFLGNLPHIIERCDGELIYSDNDVSVMMESVANAECKGTYSPDINIDQFKRHFAEFMATLEEAAEKRSEAAAEPEIKVEEVCKSVTDTDKHEKNKPIKTLIEKIDPVINTVIGAAAVFGVYLVGSQIFDHFRK